MDAEEKKRIAEELGIDPDEIDDFDAPSPQMERKPLRATFETSERASMMDKIFEPKDLAEKCGTEVKVHEGEEKEEKLGLRRQTFQQFSRSQTRTRGLSARYSEIVLRNNQSEQIDIEISVTDAQRYGKIKSFILWLFLNLFLTGYMFLLVVIFWKDWDLAHCIEDLSFWLVGYVIVQLCHVARKIVLAVIWKRAKDPSLAQTKFDVLFVCTVINFEIVWLVYGNTVVYSDDMYECRTLGEGVEKSTQLWGLCLVLVAYGYLYMLAYLLTIMFGCGVYCLYRSWSVDGGVQSQDAENAHRATQALPYIGEMDRIVLRRTTRLKTISIGKTNAQNTSANSEHSLNTWSDMMRSQSPKEASESLLGSQRSLGQEKSVGVVMSCGKCGKKFKSEDNVVHCNSGHIFHTTCFDQVKDRQSQPTQLNSEQCITCGAPMDMCKV